MLKILNQWALLACVSFSTTTFSADFIVWVNTIKEGRFEDTNKMFVKPDKFNFHVTTQDAKNWAPKILKEIK